MTGHDKDLAALLDLGTRLGVHSRAERLGLALHSARSLVSCDGATVLSLYRRGLERLALGAEPRLRGDTCPGVPAGPALFVPIRGRSSASGYLAVYRARGREPFDDHDARQITLLAAWAGLALENLRLAERVEKLAITDDLTQVYNYRFLKTALRRETRRAHRFGQEMSLI